MPVQIGEWRGVKGGLPPTGVLCIVTNRQMVALADLQARKGGFRKYLLGWDPDKLVRLWVRDDGQKLDFAPTHWKLAYKALPGDEIEVDDE